MKRRTKTFLFLLVATALSWVLGFYNEELLALAPFLFGLGLIVSNFKYERYMYSSIVCTICFFVVYIWGTLPFYLLGDLLSHNLFITQVFGFFGAFLLVLLLVKLSFKGVGLGVWPVIMIIVFPFFASVLLSNIINRTLFFFKPGDVMTNFISAMAIVQVLMSINIVSALKAENETAKIDL